ncbi:DUF3078 domain-containing protein [Taibaiella koreensis]|uniref:DUF3078 domain-containing protein n=1 Tax=Taibaiella koreensis TaxID=1268548 RepID=UPI000E5A00B3|nr:DUF3078 domain-containing protein [Taibaiella koreensis]
MKKLLLLSALAAGVLQVQAQQGSYYEDLAKKSAETKNLDTVAWIHSGVLNLGINQGILHNWAAGGELASLTVNGLFNGSLTRYNGRSIWTNNLDAAYGLFYAYSNSFVPRKTDDRIDLTSKYGYRLSDSGNFYVTGLFNAKSQFTKGYNYDAPEWDTFSTSKFLSPLYLTFAPGIEYRKGSQISVFFSPAAVRTTFVSKYYTVRDEAGAYGVENGKTFRFELGAYVTARYVKDLTKNISFRSRLDLYSNYLAKDVYNKSGLLVKKDNPGNIDILFDNFIAIKFYKFFSVNLGVVAIYDNDVPYVKTLEDGTPKNEPYEGLGWWQIKQVLSFGFNYKF